ITQIHAILMLVPRLKSLTSPLKDAINQYRKENTPEMETAVSLSLFVIENLMVSVQPDTCLLTLQYLNEKKDGNFAGSPAMPKPSRRIRNRNTQKTCQIWPLSSALPSGTCFTLSE